MRTLEEKWRKIIREEIEKKNLIGAVMEELVWCPRRKIMQHLQECC